MDINKQSSILIVDDDLEGIKILTKILSTEGYGIRVAVNGEQAVQSVLSLAPDLILMDMQMPKLDGLSACREIKKHEHLKDIPIIFITSMSSGSSLIQAFESGAVDFITKPYTIEEVHARVKTHISLSNVLMKLDYTNRNLENIIEERTASLRKSLDEKQVLIKEIHHRVNNNLQVLQSLMNLMRRAYDTFSLEDILTKFYNHVTVIARINQKLYQTDNFLDIDFSSFLLGLKNMLLEFGRQEKFDITVDTFNFKIDINHAIPLGHLMYELMANCVRYNAPVSSRKLDIKLRFDENDGFMSEITDNSSGIEEHINYSKKETPDMKILSIFLYQLNADFSYSFSNMTKFRISFKKTSLHTYNDIGDVLDK